MFSVISIDLKILNFIYHVINMCSISNNEIKLYVYAHHLYKIRSLTFLEQKKKKRKCQRI